MSERGPAPEFAGSWRITWTEVWASDVLDLIRPAYIRFDDEGLGEFGMIALRGFLDCRYGERDGRPSVEFSWQGQDDRDDACGRGWAVLEADGSLSGWLFIHCADDSEFRASRAEILAPSKRTGARRRPPVR